MSGLAKSHEQKHGLSLLVPYMGDFLLVTKAWGLKDMSSERLIEAFIT